MIERIDNLLFRTLAILFLAIGAILPLWAGLLVLLQCATWLKAGTWQPVPAVAIFMSEEAQRSELVLVQVRVSPLNLAPSIATMDSSASVVRALSGSAVGLAMIVAWLLDLALSLWLLVGAGLCLMLSGLLTARAGDLVAHRAEN